MLYYFLPIREETILTRLSEKEIIEKLNSVTTDDSKNQNFYEKEACFKGKVEESEFRLNTIIHDKFGAMKSIGKDRNANLGNFYFNIYGSIAKVNVGRKVTVKITPTTFSLSFIYVIYIAILLATFASTFGSQSPVQIVGSLLQITGYFILLFYPFYLLLFKHHSKNVFRQLENVVKNSSDVKN
jgi:hypothetical protein